LRREGSCGSILTVIADPEPHPTPVGGDVRISAHAGTSEASSSLWPPAARRPSGSRIRCELWVDRDGRDGNASGG
jgi:hypothetical protein